MTRAFSSRSVKLRISLNVEEAKRGMKELTGFNVGTGQFTAVTEVNTNEFTLFKRKRISCVGGSNFVLTYETRRVVVTGGLGVTVGFKYRVGLDDLIFQGTLEWTRIKSQRVRLFLERRHFAVVFTLANSSAVFFLPAQPTSAK